MGETAKSLMFFPCLQQYIQKAVIAHRQQKFHTNNKMLNVLTSCCLEKTEVSIKTRSGHTIILKNAGKEQCKWQKCHFSLRITINKELHQPETLLTFLSSKKLLCLIHTQKKEPENNLKDSTLREREKKKRDSNVDSEKILLLKYTWSLIHSELEFNSVTVSEWVLCPCEELIIRSWSVNKKVQGNQGKI